MAAFVWGAERENRPFVRFEGILFLLLKKKLETSGVEADVPL